MPRWGVAEAQTPTIPQSPLGYTALTSLQRTFSLLLPGPKQLGQEATLGRRN